MRIIVLYMWTILIAAFWPNVAVKTIRWATLAIKKLVSMVFYNSNKQKNE